MICIIQFKNTKVMGGGAVSKENQAVEATSNI